MAVAAVVLVIFFKIATPAFLSDVDELDTHDICTKAQKFVHQIFEMLILKFLTNF